MKQTHDPKVHVGRSSVLGAAFCVMFLALGSGTAGLCAGPSPTESYLTNWPWNSFHLKEAREVWDGASSKSNILVAVVDSWFDIRHPAISNKLWVWPGDDRAGLAVIDLVDNDPTAGVWRRATTSLVRLAQGASETNSDHGTIVTRLIGGTATARIRPVEGRRAGNRTSPRRLKCSPGVAPNAEFMLIRWRSNRSNHPTNTHDNPLILARAVEFAMSNEVRIINISGSVNANGDLPGDLEALRAAFRKAEAKEVLIVVAADNSPTNQDTNRYSLPAAYPFKNIIVVTGLTGTGQILNHKPYRRAESSAYGPTNIDIAAPMNFVLPSVFPGNYSGQSDATSYATPLVTGAAALVWGLMPRLKASEVRCLLLAHASQAKVTDDESWGHAPPAVTNGILDLSFVKNAYDAYTNGLPYGSCFKANAKDRP